ncbi:trehalose-6-phosphate synthase [uncultured Aquimarina sp.]|uniref:trehalose-6-phosphate synthase n=1 Tax=uncultured Aquimarina sp. TaxID=575652 RepID=UPI002633BF4B|nr:trehalose-6-phosphate synthase [uncultured Aquimarina sp.]
MRLVIVSNRLPITLSDAKNSKGKRSVGGLATGIHSYLEKIKNGETKFTDYRWLGWPGCEIGAGEKTKIRNEFLSNYKYDPVFLEKELIKGFYDEFCNQIIWPLFHGFPNFIEDNNSNAWDIYVKANMVFYESLRQTLADGDVVWIHDYHLMLLPALIRRDYPKIKITYFLHIPFPDLNSFKRLPNNQRIKILEGISGADLIGFHTNEYAKNFFKNVKEILQLDCIDNKILLPDRKSEVGVFPMGIDYNGIKAITQTDKCVNLKGKSMAQNDNKKIILSVDRLDYTKGILNRLKGFNNFLDQFPEWKEKVVLKLIVAPSRRDIPAYKEIKNEIDKWVGNINGTYSTNTWIPVVYWYKQIDIYEICALYKTSDIALVTPLKDGMNLIAKEYLAANNLDKGALVLSEFAGASDELKGAISINPYNVDEITLAIHQALTFSKDELLTRNRKMHDRLQSYNVVQWAKDIFDALLIKEEERQLEALSFDILVRKINQYKSGYDM